MLQIKGHCGLYQWMVKSYSEYLGEDWITFKDLLLTEGKRAKLKTEELPFKYGWLQYRQIKALFDSELEELLLGDRVKLISDVYKLLLKW